MTRMIGFFANRTDRLRCALARESMALRFGGARIDGWGVGSYQGNELLLRKRPSEHRGTLELSDLVRDLRTGCALAHARSATTGPRSAENTHPFRHRQWLFAHTGTLPHWPDVREALVAKVPEHLARAMRGSTDSELLFHVLLGALHDAVLIDHIDVDHRTVIDVLRSTLDTIEGTCGALSEQCVIVTNGRVMVAWTSGTTLRLARRRGMRDCDVCRRPSEAAGREARRIDHESLRYVMLAAGEMPEGEALPGWTLATSEARSCFVGVDHQLDVLVTAR